MALVISSDYEKGKRGSYSDDDDLVSVDRYALNVRSQEGLKISLQMAVHYKVGISFEDKSKLAYEYLDIYTRYGEKDNWNSIVGKVAISSAKIACLDF